MRATIHQLPAGSPTAAGSGPALERVPAPFSDLCAWNAQNALQLASDAERALYAAEYQLDELARVQARAAQASKQLSESTIKLRAAVRALQVSARAYVEHFAEPKS